MNLAISSPKGGVGGSTLAFNLATLFARDGLLVCIGDCDENQSCSRWHSFRNRTKRNIPLVDVVGMQDAFFWPQYRAIRSRYDLIIFDGVNCPERQKSKILTQSDFVLIPLTPSFLDISTLNPFGNYIDDLSEKQRSSLKTGVLLNQFDPRLRLDRIMLDHIKDHSLKPFSQYISRRAVYKEAFIRGLGIVEIGRAHV